MHAPKQQDPSCSGTAGLAQSPAKFRSHSVLLNRVLWRMLEALGEVGPDDPEHLAEPQAVIDRFFAICSRPAQWREASWQDLALSPAAKDILHERTRQCTVLGWTALHDDDHDAGELAGAGAAYALHASDAIHPMSQGDGYRNGEIPPSWPWSPEWWKPNAPRRSLVKAAALILAEIERFDRAGTKGGAE